MAVYEVKRFIAVCEGCRTRSPSYVGIKDDLPSMWERIEHRQIKDYGGVELEFTEYRVLCPRCTQDATGVQ